MDRLPINITAPDLSKLGDAVRLLQQAGKLASEYKRGQVDAGFRLGTGLAPVQLGFLDLALDLTTPLRTVRPFSAAVHEVSWLASPSEVLLYVRGTLVHPEDPDSRSFELRHALPAQRRSSPVGLLALVQLASLGLVEVYRPKKKGTRRVQGVASVRLTQLRKARPVGDVPYQSGARFGTTEA